MLTLRLQRTGRKKLPQYRLVAQEHSVTPSSGKVSAYLGNYNPHSKDFNFDKEAVEKHLSNGAQPSQKVAILLNKAGVKLPKWVTINQKPEKKKEEPAAVAPAKEEVSSEESTGATEDTPAAEEPVAEEAPEAASEDTKAEETN